MTTKLREEKRMRFLDMQEHPENYTAEQITELLEDKDIKASAHTMTLTKRALTRSEAGSVDVDEAWRTFADSHRLSRRRSIKAAAAAISIVFLSGTALAAALHWGVFAPSSPSATTVQKPQSTQTVPKAGTRQTADAPRDTVDMAPVTFEDAKLEQVLTAMSVFYHARLVFSNEAARHLRLYFKWDKHEPLPRQIELLNGFERINITYTDNAIIVE